MAWKCLIAFADPKKAAALNSEPVCRIILTAVKDSFMSAFKKGAEEYILKPVNRETLIGKIDEQLKKRAQG